MLGIAIAICMMSSILLGAEKFPGWGPDKVKLTSEQVSEIMNGKNNYYKFILKMNQAIKANPKIAENSQLYIQTAKKIQEEVKAADFLIIQYAYIVLRKNETVFQKIFSEYKNKESCKNYIFIHLIPSDPQLLKEYNLSIEDYIDQRLTAYVSITRLPPYRLLFNFIMKNQFNLKEDFIKNSLKKLNRIVYPKINQGDDWKKLAVQIKLMMQSYE